VISAGQHKFVMATAIVVLGGFLLRPLPASAIEMSPALQKIVAGAKKEGALSLEYGGGILGTAQGARVAAAGIKQMFGVDLNVTYTPGPSFAPMAAKLYTELQAHQAASTDVYYGTAVQIVPYLNRGLFRQIPWTTLYSGRITSDIVEGDGRALRIATGLPGVLYNKRVAPEFGKVKTMADLLKPEFKGKIYTQPYLAGFDVLVADDMWGYDKTAAYVRKYSAQIGGLLRCGEPDRIASGEVPASAIDCTGSEENLARFRNVLGLTILHDAAMRRYDYLSIPENAAHPNAGILFALYASSPEGQKRILLDLFGNGLDSYPGTPTRGQVAALEKQGVKFRDVTVKWWGAQKDIETNLKKLIKIVTER
jgi:ABC-type Fe3+ transport system substrate-binding protein